MRLLELDRHPAALRRARPEEHEDLAADLRDVLAPRVVLRRLRERQREVADPVTHSRHAAHHDTAPVAEPTPTILDCDPGHDDAIALLLAAREPRDRAPRRHDDVRQPDAREDDRERAAGARARRPRGRAGRGRSRATARARARGRGARARRERPRRAVASGRGGRRRSPTTRSRSSPSASGQRTARSRSSRPGR